MQQLLETLKAAWGRASTASKIAAVGGIAFLLIIIGSAISANAQTTVTVEDGFVRTSYEGSSRVCAPIAAYGNSWLTISAEIGLDFIGSVPGQDPDTGTAVTLAVFSDGRVIEDATMIAIFAADPNAGTVCLLSIAKREGSPA